MVPFSCCCQTIWWRNWMTVGINRQARDQAVLKRIVFTDVDVSGLQEYITQCILEISYYWTKFVDTWYNQFYFSCYYCWRFLITYVNMYCWNETILVWTRQLYLVNSRYCQNLLKNGSSCKLLLLTQQNLLVNTK